ncbi:MAG TPA: hypothetical protein VLZ75_08165 [Chitinophagales bacterium]|nr:hypothetical protein [Chitinophagales bacterium]
MIPSTPNEQVTFLKYLLQPRPIVDFFRAILYILFAILMFMIPNFLEDLPFYKYLFCVSAVLYGGYRMYRIYADYKRLYK